MSKLNLRKCNQCNQALPIVRGLQQGWLCCDENYCSQDCLDKSFDHPDVPENECWDSHYEEYSDYCYWSEWEVENE